MNEWFAIAAQDVVDAVEHPEVPALFAPKSEITPIEIRVAVKKLGQSGRGVYVVSPMVLSYGCIF